MRRDLMSPLLSPGNPMPPGEDLSDADLDELTVNEAISDASIALDNAYAATLEPVTDSDDVFRMQRTKDACVKDALELLKGAGYRMPREDHTKLVKDLRKAVTMKELWGYAPPVYLLERAIEAILDGDDEPEDEPQEAM